MSDARAIAPVTAPIDAEVRLPGSKSITNRALPIAALAHGTSRLDGVLFADDTEAMLDALDALGIGLDIDRNGRAVTVQGAGGTIPVTAAELDCRMSGTTARFLAPIVALGDGRFRLDGHPALRARPMGPVVEALAALGVAVEAGGPAGQLPFVVHGGGLRGGALAMPGDVSSQFLSGLIMAAPCTEQGLSVRLTTGLVSRPYVDMTLAVMRAFGATGGWTGDTLHVPPGAYTGRTYAVEPDASAASYAFAAAAVTGGQVRVPGLSRDSLQGDLAFADVLARMGAEVVDEPGATVVRGTGRLHGVEVDMADCSDTAPTLAVVAALADTPTRVTGIGFIRRKETDRIRAVVTELRRCGLDAREEPDGFVVHPGHVHGASIRTYDDHRMAMSFAVLGLVVPGIVIEDPGCVAKTFPDFFDVLDTLRQ